MTHTFKENGREDQRVLYINALYVEEQPLVKVLCKQIFLYTNDHKNEIIQHFIL